jgi:hypothetical protein
LKLARPYGDGSILRGAVPYSLAKVAADPLPWTDPDPVLSNAYPKRLFYRVAGVNRVFLKKEGQSLTIVE